MNIGPMTVEATLQGVIDDERWDGDYKLITHRMEHMAKTRVALTKKVGKLPNIKTIATQFDIEDEIQVSMSQGELLYWMVDKMRDLKIELDLFDWEADEKLRALDVWDATIAERPVKARQSHARVREATETPQRPHKAVRKRSEHAPRVERHPVEVWADGQTDKIDLVLTANTSEAERLMKEMNRRIAQAAGTSPMVMPQTAQWASNHSVAVDLPIIPVRSSSDPYFTYNEHEAWHVQATKPHPGTKPKAEKKSWWRRFLNNATA